MQKKHLFSLAFSRCINLSVIGLLFWIPLSEAGSATSVFKFSATFIGGSCEVTTTRSQIIFNGGEAILPVDIR
ncbi:hypothetical protein, partial [Marinospirillum sp.]|uniref:hypothetical protein n=1 Tax=Marinospirillum sp. TaxID=2183934 RepID=UPI003A8987AC